MKSASVWLINHKASLDKLSPLNEDGSEFMVGTGIVAANNMKEALSLFQKYLLEQKMEIIKLSTCEEFDPENFKDNYEQSKNLRRAAEATLEDLNTRYIGITSEAMDFEKEDLDN